MREEMDLESDCKVKSAIKFGGLVVDYSYCVKHPSEKIALY